MGGRDDSLLPAINFVNDDRALSLKYPVQGNGWEEKNINGFGLRHL